jgi:hypothetical protein
VVFGRKDQEKKDAEALARQAAQDAVLGNDVANGGEGDAVGHKPLQMLRVWALREYLQVRCMVFVHV